MKKSDKRKNARVKKGDVFKMEHLDAPYLEFFIKKIIGTERCLNGCCGMSPIGDVRFDINPKTNRTMDANLFHISKIFRENQFPFVYIDPPDEFYNPHSKEIAKYYPTPKNKGFGNPFQWQYEALNIASKALILQRNLIMTNWGGASSFQEYFLIRDSRPMGRVLEIIWK